MDVPAVWRLQRPVFESGTIIFLEFRAYRYNPSASGSQNPIYILGLRITFMMIRPEECDHAAGMRGCMCACLYTVLSDLVEFIVLFGETQCDLERQCRF